MKHYGKYIAIGFANGEVGFYKLATGTCILKFNAFADADRVRSISFPDEYSLYTGSNKGITKYWDFSPVESTKTQVQPEQSMLLIKQNEAIRETSHAMGVSKSTRFLDYYFRDQILNTVAKTMGKKDIGQPTICKEERIVEAKTLIEQQTKQSSLFRNLEMAAILSDSMDTYSNDSSATEKITDNHALAEQENKYRLNLALALVENEKSIGSESKIEHSKFPIGKKQQNKKKASLIEDKRVSVYSRDCLKGDTPIVSLQGDVDKIVAAFEDGCIVSWDRKTRMINFKLMGRSTAISTLQFNDAQLVCDGTNNLIVSHEFNELVLDDETLSYNC